MNDWKTISQIEGLPLGVKQRRPIDIARAVALTTFLQEVETNFNEEFRIVTAHPMLMTNTKDTSSEPIFTLGLYVTFSIGKVEYYIEMNDNIFFPAKFIKRYRIDNKRMCYEYAEDMNGEMYFNFGWNAEQSTINQLVTNMHRLFLEVQQRSGNTYIQEIPAYKRREKQTIYT